MSSYESQKQVARERENLIKSQAHEIDKLVAERDRLRDVLAQIRDHNGSGFEDGDLAVTYFQNLAREVLR